MGAADGMTSSMKWDPFSGLRRAMQQRADDDEAQALLADAADHGDVEPDVDQGQRTPEPQPTPSMHMNNMIRRAVGINIRPGRETPPPEIGD